MHASLIKTFGLVAATALTTAAHAAPFLSYQVTDLGNGQHALDVYVQDTDNGLGNYALTLAFEGNLQQTLAFGSLAVNTETEANTYANLAPANYDPNQDSWVAEPFASNPIPGENPLVDGQTFTGIEGGQTTGDTLLVSASSGVATPYDGSGLLLAHLVTQGDVTYAGILTRFGTVNPVQGTLAVPEPAALALLPIAGLFLTRRRR